MVNVGSVYKLSSNGYCIVIEPIEDSGSMTESPELPSWVKFSENENPNVKGADDDFVIPELADWIENQRLHDFSKVNEKHNVISTVLQKDMGRICEVLKVRYTTSEEVANALFSGCVDDVELSSNFGDFVLLLDGHFITNMAERSRRVDLISNLPDEIIIHILSFIPTTKSVVATSLLSKRWNHLWTSVPRLDFGKHGYCATLRPSYVNFVDRVLALNNVTSLRMIRLQHSGSPDLSRVNVWISSITKRDTEELKLKLYTCPAFVLPGDFFDKKTLVKLKLAITLCKIPRFVSFPNLVTIKLRCSRLEDGVSMKNMLAGCPLLKNFYIRIDVCADAITIPISSPVLEILQLQLLCQTPGDKNIVIDAPNLRELELGNNSWASYNITNAPSLANLVLNVAGAYDDEDDATFRILRNMDILRNLIHLTVVINQLPQWENFPLMLHRAPNLVTLNLYCHRVRVSWKNPEEVPRCLSSCLENVRIFTSLDKKRSEVEMISYFLEKASCLKELYVDTSSRIFKLPRPNDQYIKTLSSLPRSSSHCQVYFDGEAIYGHDGAETRRHLYRVAYNKLRTIEQLNSS